MRKDLCLRGLLSIAVLLLETTAFAQVTVNGTIGPTNSTMTRVQISGNACGAQSGGTIHFTVVGLSTSIAAPVVFSLTSSGNNAAFYLYQSPFNPFSGATNCLAASNVEPKRIAYPLATGTGYVLVPFNDNADQSLSVDFALGISAPRQKSSDFTNDNRTDMAIVRGTNFTAGSPTSWWISDTETGAATVIPWGVSGDKHLPCDYDRDGKVDAAVWRPGSAAVAGFWIKSSQTGALVFHRFGAGGNDQPNVIGDYDGDGACDIAIYRSGVNPGDPSYWYYRRSIDGVVVGAAWGQNGDFAAPGDYDGDGKNDFAVMRNLGPGMAVYLINQTTGGTATIFFGNALDIIVPGDYDGDGKTDIAVHRNAAGSIQWWIRKSSGGVTAQYFGVRATDELIQGDYDADGKTDIAVYRPGAAGTFFVSKSTGGLLTRTWGTTGDVPAARWNVH